MTRYVEALNAALHRAFAADPRVVLIGEDILDPYGGAFKVSRGLSTRYPERVITTPISEAGIVGLGIGLALQGFRPVVEIMFGDFVLLAADQLVNSALKFGPMYNGQVTVPLVVRTPMGGRRGYGPTHSQTLETFLLNAPGLRVVAPSHLHEPGVLLETAVARGDGVTLFVENKSLYAAPLVDVGATQADPLFRYETVVGDDAGYPSVLATVRGEPRADTLVIAYGGMAPVALDAARTLYFEDERNVAVWVPSQVKPLPHAALEAAAAGRKVVLVAEEAPTGWGWGAEVLAHLAERQLPARGLRVGAAPTIIPSARALEDAVLPQPATVVDALRRVA